MNIEIRTINDTEFAKNIREDFLRLMKEFENFKKFEDNPYKFRLCLQKFNAIWGLELKLQSESVAYDNIIQLSGCSHTDKIVLTFLLSQETKNIKFLVTDKIKKVNKQTKTITDIIVNMEKANTKSNVKERTNEEFRDAKFLPRG